MAIAPQAPKIQFQHNLQLPDALQMASAIATDCEAFLTNDAQLRRVPDLRVLVIRELEGR